MPDIFFKCASCGKHLVADESRRGMTINCPDCQASIAIAPVLDVQQCPRCGQRLMIAPEMKGELVHCSSCHAVIRAPGQAIGQKTGGDSVVIVCPKCHANINVSAGLSNRPTPCPSCGEQVYFRDEFEPEGSQRAEPPKPKGHDELRFRRKSQ
jgi:DNA-directed RNA polymerase subunit M/transcription elongation factor TFIIS